MRKRRIKEQRRPQETLVTGNCSLVIFHLLRQVARLALRDGVSETARSASGATPKKGRLFLINPFFGFGLCRRGRGLFARFRGSTGVSVYGCKRSVCSARCITDKVCGCGPASVLRS